MVSISDIKQKLNEIGQIPNIRDNEYVDKLNAFIEEFSSDSRKGVISLVNKASKLIDDYQKELDRMDSLFLFENKYKEYEFICGVDEVGRGPLAGPVVAGAVILPKNCPILHINDSKKLTAKKREELYDVIKENALAVATARIEHDVIDEIDILRATYKAMRQAINNLEPKATLLLNDAVNIPEIDIKQIPIIKGDAKSATIGAASIIAKVERDRLMEEYDKKYPGYDFASNKGYGSAKHIDAIKKLGPCLIHRMTFIKNFL